MALLSFAPAYLVPVLTTFFGIYAITRILSPSEYGEYAFVMSVMLLVQSGLFAWIDLGTKRFFERSVQADKLAAMCRTLYLALGICSLGLVAGCAAVLGVSGVPSPLVRLLWIAAAVIIAKEISLVSKNLELAALGRTRYMLMECGESVIGVGLGVALCWYFDFRADGILYGMLAGALSVVAFDARRTLLRMRGGAIDFGLQKEILVFSAPVAIATLIEFAMASIDRVMVQFFLGAYDLGIYAIASSIAQRAVTAVFLALGIASYPLLVRAFERGGREAAVDQARQNVEVLMALAIPAWAGFTVASGRIATVLAGPAYAERVADLLPLAGAGILAYSIRVHYFAHSQHLTGKTWSLLVASVPAVLVNIVANAALLPWMGIIGTVWAKLLAYVVALGISIIQSQRQFPLPFPIREVTRISLASLAMFGLLLVIRFPNNSLGLIELIATGAAMYGMMTIIFDLGRLRSLWLMHRKSSETADVERLGMFASQRRLG
ncbi:MAG TPA: oligosaccharide flippase family protein [Acetobacteraceae bacterium]|nr:oligosaccharide flippase family protein [Acetobacteraceae bacterium]